METLQGSSDEAGLLVGVGLLDAGHCRELAAGAELVTVGVDPVTRMPLLHEESPAGTSLCSGLRTSDRLEAEGRRLAARLLDPTDPRVTATHSHEAATAPAPDWTASSGPVSSPASRRAALPGSSTSSTPCPGPQAPPRGHT